MEKNRRRGQGQAKGYCLSEAEDISFWAKDRGSAFGWICQDKWVDGSIEQDMWMIERIRAGWCLSPEDKHCTLSNDAQLASNGLSHEEWAQCVVQLRIGPKVGGRPSQGIVRLAHSRNADG
eukprot:8843461-Pyramimonas_sp.AAC.1